MFNRAIWGNQPNGHVLFPGPNSPDLGIIILGNGSNDGQLDTAETQASGHDLVDWLTGQTMSPASAK